MTVKQLLYIIAICFLGSGCRLGANFIRTEIVEPIQFPSNWDDMLEKKRFRHLARCAFESARAIARAEQDDYEHEPFSADARSGFEAGFIDYLDAGGIGYLPPLPPRRYWKAAYQTPEGQRAMKEWFSAYEHGAAMAESSGYRQFVTVSASDSLALSTEPYFGQPTDAPETAEPAATDPGADDEADDEADDVIDPTDAERSKPIITRVPPILETEPAQYGTADLGMRGTDGY